MEIKELVILYLPAILYYIIWQRLNRTDSKTSYIYLYPLSVVVLFIYGLYDSKSYTEITIIGNGVLYTSSVILLAPILMLLKYNTKYSVQILSLLIIPFVSFYMIFFTESRT